MKYLLSVLLLACALAARGEETAAPGKPALVGRNSNFLIKLTSSISTTTSKVGDKVTGVVILPVAMRGGRVVGTVDRADHSIIHFSFQTMTYKDYTWTMQTELGSIVSSKGNAGQDDLGQRVRVDGGGFIAYGTSMAIDEGAEIRFAGWEK